MAKRILFIKIRKFSHINAMVEKIIRRNFLDYSLDVVDAADLAGMMSPVNILRAIQKFGFKILHYGYSGSFFRMSRTHRLIKERLCRKINPKDYSFSIQTQSLFDGSISGLPHFVYTDCTHVASSRDVDASLVCNDFAFLIKVIQAMFTGNNEQREFLKYCAEMSIEKQMLSDKERISLEKEIYENAAINFTMSTDITRSLVEDYKIPQNRVQCIYVGGNTLVEQEKRIESREEKYQSKTILFVGVNWERKGGPVLVEAFKKVLAKEPQAKLIVVGCSPKLNIPHCKIAGRISREDVSHYYEQASVFCLPTRKEPFGVSCVEAISHKLPVVATSVGAIPDYIQSGENGYLMDVNDPDKCAEYLLDFINNPEKAKTFGEHGYNVFSQRYNWENVGRLLKENILTYLNDLAEEIYVDKRN